MAQRLTQEANDIARYDPMLAATRAALDAIGTVERLAVVLPDATAEDPNRSIATQKESKCRRAARELGTTAGPSPECVSPLEAMEHAPHTPEGAAAYEIRSHAVEPVFADS